jgi:CheY-like chemotaxis protein
MMKILIAIRDNADSLRIAGIVRELGHSTAVANHGRDVAMVLGKALPQVVFVDADILMPSGREIVRHLRKLVSPHYIYIILFSKDENPPQLARHYEAGVDNEIEPPISPYQIEAKLYAAQRILSFEDSLKKRIDTESGENKTFNHITIDTGTHNYANRSVRTVAATPSQDFVALTPGDIILRSSAWRSMRETFRSAIARFLLIDFESSLKEGAAPTEAYRVVLANQSKQLEIHLILASTQQNIKEIAGYMFGTQSEAGPRVLEGLAQMLSTALSDSLATEQLKFSELTAGEYSTERLQKESEHLTESLFFSLGKLRFSVYINLRVKGNSLLPVTALQEGMLIGKDILNNKGLLLLSKGTRISPVMKERLRECLPQTHMIEVVGE